MGWEFKTCGPWLYVVIGYSFSIYIPQNSKHITAPPITPFSTPMFYYSQFVFRNNFSQSCKNIDVPPSVNTPLIDAQQLLHSSIQNSIVVPIHDLQSCCPIELGIPDYIHNY